MSSAPSFLDSVVLSLITGKSVLDVGCGYGRWGSLIMNNFWEIGYKHPPKIYGFDGFKPNVDLCKQREIYDEAWYQLMPSPIEGKWDTVLAVEFIEHIPEKDIKKVVEILEKSTKKRIIFTTPNFPSFRKGLTTLKGFNKYEAHLSYIPATFFKERGYTVMGAGFGNPTNKLVQAILALWPRAAYYLESIPRAISRLGITTVAYKDIS